MMSHKHTSEHTFLATLKDLMGDAGVIAILIIAPLIYGFYYPWPYSTQIAHNLPVAIVDNSNDQLSRTISRLAKASPTLTVSSALNEDEAQQQLLSEHVMAYMVIPRDLQKNVTKGNSAVINIIANDNYVLASKNTQKALRTVVATVSAGIEMRLLAPTGMSQQQRTALVQPIALNIDPMHNTNEGYGSYIVPAVAWLILQQTLLIGCAMLIGRWYENKCAYATPRQWLYRIWAVSCVHALVSIGYTGWLFYGWGYPSGGNPLGNLLLIAIFSPCVAALGFLVGLAIKDRERSIQLLTFSSLPIYFVCGLSWPTQQLPFIFQWISWFFPSSSAIRAGVNMNQLGASLADNSTYIIVLAVLCIVNISALFWFGRNDKP